MTFDTNIRWVTGDNGLIDPETHAWNDLNASGYTAMGAAFNELNNKLSVSSGFMNRASGSVAPVLFLLSDGEPSDKNYEDDLQKLQDNNWYKVAVRVAIGYGQSDDAVLAKFTGNSETVLHTNDPKDLKALIKFVAITSSMVASKGKAVQGNTPADQQAANDMTNALADALRNSPPSLASDDTDW